MKMWPVIICLVVILIIVWSPVAGISKADLISAYKSQSIPTTAPSQLPSGLPIMPAQPPLPTPGPSQGQDMAPSIWDKSTLLQKIWEERGPWYKTDPASPFLYDICFADTTSKSG